MIAKRELRLKGPAVGCLGYGAMLLEGYYGSTDDDEALTMIGRALDSGMTMIDSADAYGNGHNESLVGRAIRGRRDKAFVCTKLASSSIRPDKRVTTVLEGTIYIGFGQSFDESKLVAVVAGAVCVIPANLPHYVCARDREPIYQETGVGVTGTPSATPPAAAK